MSAINKEKIFEELRNYHTHRFPAKIKNLEVETLRVEFGEIEDRIVGMILSLVNGKAEFIDGNKDLVNFQDKLRRNLPHDSTDDTARNLFATKISQLIAVMTLAKDSGFKLRPVRGVTRVAAKV